MVEILFFVIKLIITREINPNIFFNFDYSEIKSKKKRYNDSVEVNRIRLEKLFMNKLFDTFDLLLLIKNI